MSEPLAVREAPASYLVELETQRVRPGYKQTEVGVIPEGWEVLRFGEIATPRKQRIDPKKSGVQEFCVELEHIGSGTGALVGSTSTSEQSSLKSVFRAADVLFGKLRAYLRKYWLANRAGVCSTEIWVLSPTDKLASSAYLFQIAQTDKFIEAASSSYGTHMPRSDWSVVRNYVVPIPPTKAEQEAIAEALSDADALIEALEQLIAKKRHLKQGAMQELLTGKKRLPGFSGEWEVKRLGEMGSTFGGLTGKTKSDFGEGATRYITFMNIMANVVIDCGTFEHVKVSPTESQNCVMKGDLFFNGSSETPEEVGMCAVLLEDVQDVFLNSFCFGFRLKNLAEADGLYFAYYFRSIEGRELLKSLAQGATRYNLSKTAFLKIAFPLPPFIEQTAIATLLSDMDAEIAALEARLAKARGIKQGMMQELLTGKIRLV